MAVEASGTIKMTGDTGPGTHVRVHCDGDVLKIVSGAGVLGQWPIHRLGIQALNEGFTVRAEGEEFLLLTDDDPALAEEMGIVAVSPRLARQVAARHRPAERPVEPEPESAPSRVGPIAFALAGALILVGSSFLRASGADAVGTRGGDEVIAGSGVEFWMAFAIGGALTVAVAYILSIGVLWARLAAIVVMVAMIVLFGVAVGDTPTDASHLTAYGYLAGGLAVGVSVLFSGTLEDHE